MSIAYHTSSCELNQQPREKARPHYQISQPKMLIAKKRKAVNHESEAPRLLPRLLPRLPPGVKSLPPPVSPSTTGIGNVSKRARRRDFTHSGKFLLFDFIYKSSNLI